ncbi:hypothetical protein C8J57DRAFT_1362331, partial [Mycena rebaudengoi]
MNYLSQMRDSEHNYIELGEMLSNLAQWIPYIHRNPTHWITISQSNTTMEFDDWQLQTQYLSVLERIWGVNYAGTYQFTEDTEKNLAWTLIMLSIVWEGFDFSGQQTLQDFYQLIRCTLSTSFKLQYMYRYYRSHHRVRSILNPPNFRVTFYTPLGDALIQAAKKARDIIPSVPTQSDNQLDLDSSLQEKTEVLHQVARTLDEMGQALKLESEGEQVDRGEERAEKYWDNLRKHFEEQVDQLEEA